MMVSIRYSTTLFLSRSKCHVFFALSGVSTNQTLSCQRLFVISDCGACCHLRFGLLCCHHVVGLPVQVTFFSGITKYTLLMNRTCMRAPVPIFCTLLRAAASYRMQHTRAAFAWLKSQHCILALRPNTSRAPTLTNRASLCRSATKRLLTTQ